MVEKVIVAVDGGQASKAALEWVLHRASTAEFELELTSVIELGWTHESDFREYEYSPAYERALAEAAERVEQVAPTLKRTSVVRRGVPVDELTRASAGADLLVIGSNKTGVLAGAVYGTLPLRVAARAHCPVVVVSTGWTPSAIGDRKVIAGTGDDETAEFALGFAAREAARLGCPLDLVHTWTIPSTISFDLGATVPADALLAAHEEILTKTAQGIRDAHPGLVVNEILKQGPAAPELVAASKGAELLVVGTHRRGAVAGLILGSVSHDVLLNLPCPVAVVPRPEAKVTSE